MHIYLIRHAQTAWNQKNLAIGQSDVPLSDEGYRQVQALADRFSGVSLDRIISSDLMRCRITAQAVAQATGAEIEVHAEVRERSFGEWESQDYASVSTRLHELALQNELPLSLVKAPGGESHVDVWNRVEPVILPLFDAEGAIAIVSHGGTSRVLLSMLLRATPETSFCFKFDNTSVTRLDRRPEGPFLLSVYNDTSHLNRLA